jgi:hypothetical protein
MLLHLIVILPFFFRIRRHCGSRVLRGVRNALTPELTQSFVRSLADRGVPAFSHHCQHGPQKRKNSSHLHFQSSIPRFSHDVTLNLDERTPFPYHIFQNCTIPLTLSDYSHFRFLTPIILRRTCLSASQRTMLQQYFTTRHSSPDG